MSSTAREMSRDEDVRTRLGVLLRRKKYFDCWAKSHINTTRLVSE